MGYDGFLLETKDKVATLMVNRPEKLNSFTWLMAVDALPRLLRDVRLDDSVRVLIITGAGRAFCAGADVNELSTRAEAESKFTTEMKLQPLGYWSMALHYIDKPVIAAINGVAAGLGLSLAMLTDVRIASEKATLSFAFVKRGLIPDAGATLLAPRLIGAAKSFELMYTGETLTASQAKEIGLVNKVTPHETCLDEARSLAAKIANGPPMAMAQTKRAINLSFLNSLEQQLHFESYAQNLLLQSQDFKEGVAAFLEKREAHFTGR